MKRSFTSLLAALLVGVLLTGCYSSRISTNKEPNGQIIEKPFATGFIAGLATPGARFYADRCTYGVARMETSVSFLNLLASNITFGLYSPMSVEVYCAEQGSGQTAFLVPDSSASSPTDVSSTDARD